MPGAHTVFRPLWTDADNALELLERKSRDGILDPVLAARLQHLIEHGYVILPGAIDISLADSLRTEINTVSENPEYYIARRQRKAYAHPDPDIYEDPTFRLIDYHVNSRLAREAIFNPATVAVLRAAFEDTVNAFQCLTFAYGSQQSIHQDGAYVVVSEPLQFMACWIALEDVQAGSGELVYYAGSHKLDDHLFAGNSKCWIPEKHGQEAHAEFLGALTQRCEQANLPRLSFLPKKGDALIWASDLAHGGSKLINDQTRYSMVAHYCPGAVRPNFSTFTNYYHPLEIDKNCSISSRHYDLRQGRMASLLKRWRPESATLQRPAFMGGQ